jgi:hypothetical protein
LRRKPAELQRRLGRVRQAHAEDACERRRDLPHVDHTEVTPVINVV